MRSPSARLGREKAIRRSLPLLVSEHQLDMDGLHFLEFIDLLLLIPSQCYQFSCGHLSCGPLAGSGPTFSPIFIYSSNPPHKQSNLYFLAIIISNLYKDFRPSIQIG